MVSSGALEGRLEPLYYVPEIVELENKVRKLANGKLRDYILKIASGATPSVKEEEKFYSDAENGIPFIRVQNLSPTNEVRLEDLKYINLETHENYLKRSQVYENDLLIKITGVGRMAVASIAPKGFVGNTNQHLVVIKTKDLLTSEVLATFLNTDIGERLASRRSTGGTRPALDYSALKSIPIIFNPEIVEIIKKAVENKKAKEAEAKALLEGIDEYLMEKLGIINAYKGSKPLQALKQKHFFVQFSQVQGKRFDPFYHKVEFEENIKAVKNAKYEAKPLKQLIEKLVKGKLPKDQEKEGVCKVVQINSIRENGNIEIDDLLTAQEIFTSEQRMQINDVLVVITGATIGKIAIWEQPSEDYFLGGDIVKFQCLDILNTQFVFAWLRFQSSQLEIKRNITGATNGHLAPYDVGNILIPLPPLPIQTEIAEYISAIRSKAKALEAAAREEVERAKAEVERMLLGE
jgi:restriction endonuclease S subunit